MRCSRQGRALVSATALLVALSASHCGYRLAGTNPAIPKHVRVIAVVAFENRTARPEIEQRVTEQVSSELSKRGGYRVITSVEESDAQLTGAITSYRTSPVQFGEDGRQTQVEAVVTLEASLQDMTNDQVIWSQKGLVFRERFELRGEGEFFDEETVALDEIARGAAGLLVASIFEGF